MTKQKTKDTGGAGRKVTTLRAPPAGVEPPEGWRLDTEHGYMATDGTSAGRLVRLHDVIDWLRSSRSIPVLEACRIVEASLDGMQTSDFYSLRSGDYASAFDGQEDFTPGLSERSFWDKSESSGHGVASLKVWLSHGRQEGSDGVCSGVAVKLTKAHELWGYGQPAPVTQIDALDLDKADEWTGEKLKSRHAELKADGKGKPTQRLAAESGLSEREIRRRKAAVTAGGAVGSMVGQLSSASGKKHR